GADKRCGDAFLGVVFFDPDFAVAQADVQVCLVDTPTAVPTNIEQHVLPVCLVEYALDFDSIAPRPANVRLPLAKTTDNERAVGVQLIHRSTSSLSMLARSASFRPCWSVWPSEATPRARWSHRN